MHMTPRKSFTPGIQQTPASQAEYPRRMALRAHPLFGTALALWCVALFSLSTLAVDPSLLARLIHFGRAGAMLAPVSTSVRLLLAMIMGGLGALVGQYTAKRFNHDEPAASDETFSRVASFRVPSASRSVSAATSMTAPDPLRIRLRDAHPDAPPRMPISASVELGFSFDEPAVSSNPPTDTNHDEMPMLPTHDVPLTHDKLPVLKERSEKCSPEPSRTFAQFPPPAASGPTAAERIAGASPRDLGSVELLERLAITLTLHSPPEHIIHAHPASPAPVDTRGNFDVDLQLNNALAMLRATG